MKDIEKIKYIVYEIDNIDRLLEEVNEQENLCLLNNRNALYLINTIWGKEATLDVLNYRKKELIKELVNMFKD